VVKENLETRSISKLVHTVSTRFLRYQQLVNKRIVRSLSVIHKFFPSMKISFKAHGQGAGRVLIEYNVPKQEV
jgi:hypothetical protein